MNHLRILQIFNQYLLYGGEQKSALRIYESLKEDYNISCYNYSTEEFLNTNRNPFSKFTSAFSNKIVLKNLRELQRKLKSQIWLIHNVFPTMSPVVYEEAFKMGIPVVQYLHNYRLSCVNGMFLNHGEPCQRCINGSFLAAAQTACWHDSHLQSAVMGLILNKTRNLGVFQKVAQWIAISQAQKDIHVRMGVPEDKINVIHHFIEPNVATPSFAKAKDVLFVGRLSKEKGVHILLEAWGKIKASSALLRIVGDGPELLPLQAQVMRENITGVVFEGFKQSSEMSEIWEETLFSVVPSIWEETFGLTVLEAWNQGRPVLASRIGSLPELINDGSTGWLAKPASADAWAHQLDHALSNRDNIQKMGQEGYRQLSQRFSKASWHRKIETTFSRLNGSSDS